MKPKVMALFDSLTPREEAVDYSIRLARRLKYCLVFLFVLPMEETTGTASEIGDRAREAALSPLQLAARSGVEAEAEIRAGNAGSELMKYLAEMSSVKMIVWGGHDGGPGGDKSHWLMKVMDKVNCPVVSPRKRARGKLSQEGRKT